MQHNELMKSREASLKILMAGKKTDKTLDEFFKSIKKLFELVAFVRVIYGISEDEAIQKMGEVIEAKCEEDKEDRCRHCGAKLTLIDYDEDLTGICDLCRAEGNTFRDEAAKDNDTVAKALSCCSKCKCTAELTGDEIATGTCDKCHFELMDIAEETRGRR